MAGFISYLWLVLSAICCWFCQLFVAGFVSYLWLVLSAIYGWFCLLFMAGFVSYLWLFLSAICDWFCQLLSVHISMNFYSMWMHVKYHVNDM